MNILPKEYRIYLLQSTKAYCSVETDDDYLILVQLNVLVNTLRSDINMEIRGCALTEEYLNELNDYFLVLEKLIKRIKNINSKDLLVKDAYKMFASAKELCNDIYTALHKNSKAEFAKKVHNMIDKSVYELNDIVWGF